MTRLLTDFTHEFRRHKDLADRALSQLDDDGFFRRLADQVNPVALIVTHVAGNLRSRPEKAARTGGSYLPNPGEPGGVSPRM